MKIETEKIDNELTSKVIGLAIQVHAALGPGLLESVYQETLFYELINAGLYAEKQKPLPVVYKDVKLEAGYRVDILVEKKLIIEIKAVEALNDVHMAQILTYMKLSDCRLGLLINFNVRLLKDGIKRMIL